MFEGNEIDNTMHHLLPHVLWLSVGDDMYNAIKKSIINDKVKLRELQQLIREANKDD